MASEGAAADCKREERAPEDSGVVADVGMENGNRKTLFAYVQADTRPGTRNACMAVFTHVFHLCTRILIVAIQRQPSLEHGCRELDYIDLEFVTKVGKGASGTVYKGKLVKKWDVAIKEIGEMDETFEQEIDKLSKLNHPNIIRLYGRCSYDRYCYIIAEYADQGSLNDHIKGNRGKPHKESSLRWAAEITEGMCYLHENGVVHRDLKPRNILLTGKTIAKICDFGIACDLDRTKTVSQVVGTHCYIAREIILKEKYSNSCDVFSFGMVLWELATHETPFEGKTEYFISNAIVNGEFPDIPSHVEEYIADLIKKCWNIREDRPKFKEVQKILKENARLVKDSSEVTEAPNTQTVPSRTPNMAPADGSPSNSSVATPPSSQTEQAPPPASGTDQEKDTPGNTPSPPQPEYERDTNGDSQAASGDGTANPEQPAEGEQNTTDVDRDDVQSLADVLHPIAASWELFLGQLPGFPHDQIGKISRDIANDRKVAKSCLIQGLQKLCGSEKPVTYGDIAAVMEKTMLPNKPLAKKIRHIGKDNETVKPEDVSQLIADYLHEIAGDWELFLGQLTMPQYVVKEIKGCSNFSTLCLIEGLDFWVVSTPTHTYEQIAEVLRGEVVKKYPLAKKVEGFAEKKRKDFEDAI